LRDTSRGRLRKGGRIEEYFARKVEEYRGRLREEEYGGRLRKKSISYSFL
jgi:hypothetical protein